MRPISGLTASLLLLVGLVACTDDRKPVDETQTVEPVGFGCLDDIGEVVDDPLNPTPAPFCRIGVLAALQLDGRPVPTVAVIDRGAECSRTPKGYAIDLAPGVAARFHAAFQARPRLRAHGRQPGLPAAGCLRAGYGVAGRRANRARVHHRRHRAGHDRRRQHAVPAGRRERPAGRGRLRPRALAGHLPHRHGRAHRRREFPRPGQPAPGALRRGRCAVPAASPRRSARRRHSSRPCAFRSSSPPSSRPLSASAARGHRRRRRPGRRRRRRADLLLGHGAVPRDGRHQHAG